jgi:DNA-binding transcriptional MerR regulator
MTTTKYELTVVRNRRDLMAIEEVASHFHIHPDLLRHFIDAGLLEPAEVTGNAVMLDLKNVKRVRTIQRLRCDLGVNLAGIGVIFDLLDRLRSARSGVRNGY